MKDIIVVGGGLNGLTCAISLAQLGFQICVLDRQKRESQLCDGFDGRSYALALASVRCLQNIGVWSRVAEFAQPMLEIKASDGRAGEGASDWMLHFREQDLPDGPMGYMLEDRHLRAALFAEIDSLPNVQYIEGCEVVSQSRNVRSMDLTVLSGGVEQTFSAGVLIGADGRASQVAKRAGLQRFEHGYAQSALVCAVAHDKPHNSIAHQFFMPNGPLAILPLTQNRSSIVWSETTARAQELFVMDDSSFLSALRPAFGSFLGELSLVGARFCYPLGLSVAYEIVHDQIALVGDAVRGVHPIAGQGLNAGLRDVAALYDVLNEARLRGEDLGTYAVLRRYQSWRRFDGAGLVCATDQFNRLFSNNNMFARFGRDLGMGIVGGLPKLRRAFMREAAGVSGDLPSLMQG